MQEFIQVADAFSSNLDGLARTVETLKQLAPASSAAVCLDDELELGQWDREVQLLRDQVASLEDRVKICQESAGQAQKRFDLAERLNSIVSMYLDPGANQAALMERVLAEAPVLEKNKAFRMVREKVLKRAERETGTTEAAAAAAAASPAAVSPGALTLLSRLRDLLNADQTLNGVAHGDLLVVGAVAECASAVTRNVSAPLGELERIQIIEGMWLLLSHRFGREADIPLYAALHHNSLLLLARSVGDAHLVGVLGDEAQRVLSASALRAAGEAEVHAAELVAGAVGVASSDLARRQLACAKRCAHVMTAARRGWSAGGLAAEALERATAGAAAAALEGLAASVRAWGGGHSDTERAGLAQSLDEAVGVVLAAAGLEKDKEAGPGKAGLRAVLGRSWSRLRKTRELLGGAAPRLEMLTCCFARDELLLLLPAACADGPAKSALAELKRNNN